MGFKILSSVLFFFCFFFVFFGGGQKNEYFLGMKILWIFLGGHHKTSLYLGVISMHFWVFFKVKVQNGGILGVTKISNIFGGS